MDDIFSGLDLSATDLITGASYDGSTQPGVADSAAIAPASSSTSFLGTLSSFGSSLLNFGSQALPVATQVNNLVNATQAKTAQNNTASATGTFAQVAASPIVWIVAAVGVVLLVLFAGRSK